jgi:hypothetical protein
MGLPLWMGEVPDYDVVEGNMQIVVGEFCIAMPVNVFLKGCARGKAAVARWEQSHHDAEIIKFPKTG